MDYKAEGIKPYDEETDKTTQVREMFDSIAVSYTHLTLPTKLEV